MKDLEKLDFSKSFRQAEDHVRLEKLNDEIKDLKGTVFKEVMQANSAFEKLIEQLPSDIQHHQSVNLENLIYAIGRIKASAQ